MEETRPYVSWDLIQNFMIDAFQAAGVPEEDAKICTDVLMESDRRGIESHGTNRFKPIYIDRINDGILNPVTHYEVLKDTPTTCVADAHDGMGMVASYKMMTSLIDKAKKYGLAMGAIKNSSHYGIAGYWATMASKEGMLGITGTNARPSIAPTFGVENMMGTNPLTFAFPTDEDFDFILDCATSIVQRGKIEYYARSGKPTPKGMVIAHDGTALTDSEEILKKLVEGTAALTPLGGIGDEMAGYKGYGYAAVVEILSAALTGGLFMKDLTNKNPDGTKRPYHLGHFFLVINPEFFMGLDTFKKTAGDILRGLRNSQKAPGHDRIYTAGEKEWDVWQVRKDKGVPMGKGVQDDFKAVRDMYHLNYHFPFED
ncbi:MAG: Ldh family oxidoreductase [Absicoccus porci]|uniref:Ldh family oxidoreductase n=1 Tax=Absicoccus porci TaxID=2486576 RepID=A0A3N0HXF3_9FIRM|nr:Ldh family oxidoreductase [Absicoccus porci]MCI6088637.1 Ldh family oxidoreductase [Absicoccus porci]MDD6459286.1 Ldh family oxidoreductase [Absicoccus porci]MDD7330299.1 Ldh family oxidoreductase [Absicoccus porci]MDY4738732.1 Ldh family oxidoreductase [Absicoccus porci]MEE1355463.1 Ldh family oxidoreductase [Absicoccus porci]